MVVLSLFDGISCGKVALERAGIPVSKYYASEINKYRKLTPIECERLQTLPDNYTEGISNTQRYKALGNAWTVDVVSHIFSYLKPIV